MIALQIVILILWMFLGIWNLSKRSEITKIDYACPWVLLILNIVIDLMN